VLRASFRRVKKSQTKLGALRVKSPKMLSQKLRVLRASFRRAKRSQTKLRALRVKSPKMLSQK
jgi:hypothetical protein